MKVIFLDFDGVVTAKNGTPGSYMTHGQDEYGPTPKCIKLLLKLASRTGAKFVVSSNWRKFDTTGPGSIWRHSLYGDLKNPLPSFIPLLGNTYFCSLPVVHRLPKASLAEEWLSRRSDIESFVALDDMCEYEGYAVSKTFQNRYIQTDPETGFSEADLARAGAILSRLAANAASG